LRCRAALPITWDVSLILNEVFILVFSFVRPWALLVFVVVWAVLPNGPALAGETGTPPRERTNSTSRVSYKYEIEVQGSYPDSLLKTFQSTLEIFTGRKDTPKSRAQLLGRLEASLQAAENVLDSEGYYAGTIAGRLMPQADRSAKRIVRLNIEAGRRYRFAKTQITADAADDALLGALQTLAGEVIQTSAPAKADVGVRLAPAFLVRLKELGHPFAHIEDQRFIVDHKTQHVTPIIALDLGPKVRICDLDISGLTTIEPSYVRLLADIAGKPIYDQRLIDAFRDRLIQTGLFSGIQITPEPPAARAQTGSVSDSTLRVVLTEGPQRQVSAQAGFSTDQGFSVEGAWTHRNFFGRNEVFTVRGRIAQLEQSIDTLLTLPNFGRIDQTLNFNLGFSREDNEAFNLLSITGSTILERRLSKAWIVSGGGRLEAQRVEDDLGRRTFYLGGIPLSARYDGTENFFDPQDGIRLDVVVTPEAGFGDASLFFITNDVILRGYKSLNWAKGTVLAARIRVGAIAGEDTVTLPANRRFYAGGGGSIRGYGFQDVGPLDTAGNPFGGRSLLEVAAEARIKVTSTIGVVPFLDFGNVYDSALPGFSNLQYGAGIGLRYHTDFAPIRFDIGTPINPRANDDRVQVYISIGQNF